MQAMTECDAMRGTCSTPALYRRATDTALWVDQRVNRLDATYQQQRRWRAATCNAHSEQSADHVWCVEALAHPRDLQALSKRCMQSHYGWRRYPAWRIGSGKWDERKQPLRPAVRCHAERRSWRTAMARGVGAVQRECLCTSIYRRTCSDPLDGDKHRADGAAWCRWHRGQG